MKTHNVFQLFWLVSAISLAGCGGSSSDSTQGSSELEKDELQPAAKTLSVPSYGPQTITDRDSERLVKSTYQHLRYMAWDTIVRTDQAADSFSPDQLVREFTETDTFDLSDFACKNSGSFKIKVLQGYPELNYEDDLFFGPGDKFSFVYDNCASEDMTLPGYTREGSTTIEVIEGYVGLFGGGASQNTVIQSYANKNGYLSDGKLAGYVDGDMKSVRGSDSIVFTGSSFKENPSNNVFLEYYLGNYSLKFEKVVSTTSFDRWNFSSDSEFLFGINALGGHFKAELHDLIYTNDALETGVIELSDGVSSLRIELFSSHLTYELDFDGDGVYEIERMINREEF